MQFDDKDEYASALNGKEFLAEHMRRHQGTEVALLLNQ